MPTLVQELSSNQRMWLYENQRTLSEEGSAASQQDTDSNKSNSSSVPRVDSSKSYQHHHQRSHIASSPSWQQQQQEAEERDSTSPKRRKLHQPEHRRQQPYYSHHDYYPPPMTAYYEDHYQPHPFAPPPPKSQPRTLTATNAFPHFPHAGDKLTWQQSYENLQAYAAHYGDCHVPQKYRGNPKLGGWVNKQRKKHRNPTKYGRLKQEHVDLLTEMGFKWH